MGREMEQMTAQIIISLLLALMMAVMGIRHGLRAKCLGRCANCPCAESCAYKTGLSSLEQES